MQANKLVRDMVNQSVLDEDCLVVFQNVETGEIFTILGSVYDFALDDGEGHLTSTGSTLFIMGQPT